MLATCFNNQNWSSLAVVLQVHHRLSNLGAVRTDQEAVHEKLVKKR